MLSIAGRAGHELNPELLRRYDEEVEEGHRIREAQRLTGPPGPSDGNG